MDKNMIHIDDLVKHRLSGGEERQLLGSWDRMRDLLDKEMPEKRRVAGYYWRRMLGVVAGLAVLSAVSVGSYQLATSFREENRKSETARSADHIATAGTPRYKTPGSPVAEGSGSAATGVTVTEMKGNNKISSASRSDAAGTVATTDKASEPGTVSSKTIKSTASNRQTSGLAHTQRTEPRVKTVAAVKVQGAANKATHEKPLANRQKATMEDRTMPNRTTEDQNLLALNAKPVTVSGNNTLIQKQPEIEPLPGLKNVVADNTRSQMPAPQEPDRLRDTLSKLTIIQRYAINPLTRTSRMVSDTLAMERLAIELPGEPLAASAAYQVAASAPVTASEAPLTPQPAAESGAGDGLVPLSSLKVESRRTNAWNSRSFDEVVRDMKFSLAQVKFYPGISAGANSYLFGPNNFGGIQLGLFGLFTFGEAWSAMGELKYVHRFNNGSTVKDSYYDVTGPQGSQLQRKVEHFFKFSSLQSIEMPLALRFAAGRLNIFGGANLAYNFGVNAEEAIYPDSSYKPAPAPNFGNTSPTISYDDFKARFALGGLAGLSYEFSPSLQFDMRATKNFWDNASGAGASEVSRQLYRAPSFQFSIFYRFSQRNQIPRAK